MHVFGCLAFASTLSAHCTKFKPQARACVFIGYPMGMKAYKLYDIQAKQVFISRDVIFHEHVFPFHTIHGSIRLYDLFPDFVLPISAMDVPIPPISTASVADSSTLRATATSSSPTTTTTPSSSSLNVPPPVPPNVSPTTTHTVPYTTRHSSRVHYPPSYLRDYHCNLLSHYGGSNAPTNSTPYPLSQVISYDSLSPSYRNLILNVTSHDEPQFYHQTVKCPQWCDAMKTELNVLEVNKTWSVVQLPPGQHSIGCKWIYTMDLQDQIKV